jgi:hypothetical protein
MTFCTKKKDKVIAGSTTDVSFSEEEIIFFLHHNICFGDEAVYFPI